MAAQRDRRPPRLTERANFTVASAIGAINPIVESPKEAVDAKLLVSLTEPREEHLAHLRSAIAVRVFEIPKIGCGGDQDTPFPRQDARRKWQLVCEDAGAFILAIPIAVFQHPNLSAVGLQG